MKLDEPQPDLRNQIESHAGKQGRAPGAHRGAIRCKGGRDDDEDRELIELDQLSPQELFSRAWLDSYGTEVDEQTLQDFATLLQDVQLEGEQP